jgi:membrane-associated phospholipid phosphatase
VATLQGAGIRLIQALQSASPGLDGLMALLTFLGNAEFYLLVLPFAYWSVDRRLGMRALLVLICVDTLGNTVKLLLHQPRPYWLEAVKPLATEASYGIPSSHASDSAAVWGYLALRSGSRRLRLATAALILLVGLSRLYLGVHFPHDVAFGWLLGFAVAWAFVRTEARVALWADRQSIPALLAAALAFSAGVLLIGQLTQAVLAALPDTDRWAVHAAAARSPTYAYSLAGALFGAVSGYALMTRYAPFGPSRSWPHRWGRYALGIVGVMLIYFGLDRLFGLLAEDETAAGCALRWARYAAVTFWVLFVAPGLFLRAGLAEPETKAASGGPQPG